MIPKKILFCTDFSKNALPAQQCALDYAKCFGAAVIILHVIGAWPVHAYKDKVRIDEHRVVQGIKEPVNVDLALIADKFRKELKDVEAHTRFGAPADEIVRLAKEESVCLIVMGTHGWTGFRYMMLGSVAEKVMRAAPCSVLVVRSQSEGS